MVMTMARPGRFNQASPRLRDVARTGPRPRPAFVLLLRSSHSRPSSAARRASRSHNFYGFDRTEQPCWSSNATLGGRARARPAYLSFETNSVFGDTGSAAVATCHAIGVAMCPVPRRQPRNRWQGLPMRHHSRSAADGGSKRESSHPPGLIGASHTLMIVAVAMLCSMPAHKYAQGVRTASACDQAVLVGSARLCMPPQQQQHCQLKAR